MARSKSDKAFDERVAQYSEELRELLTDLYGEQADEAFRNLTELMAKAHDARPADLKRLDTKRLADPEWYKRGNMFGMTMYTDLFAGDLKKLADKVPYLKEQKLTYLHLMPLLKMPHPQNDGGYAVEDFDTVDPVARHQRRPRRAHQETACGGHQPVPRLRDEPHRIQPSLGQSRSSGRSEISGLLLLPRRPHHPRPV